MSLDKNRCQDKLQLQKYTKDVVCSIDAETEKKWVEEDHIGVPLIEKRGKEGRKKVENRAIGVSLIRLGLPSVSRANKQT